MQTALCGQKASTFLGMPVPGSESTNSISDHMCDCVHWGSNDLLGGHAQDEKASFQMDEHEAAILSSFRKLAVMESMYRFLLGDKIRYQMGEHGPHLDLFFLCVIMNQKDLAFEVWKNCPAVPAAIVGVRLLHLYTRSAHAHNQ
jgi:hypothetical protein